MTATTRPMHRFDAEALNDYLKVWPADWYAARALVTCWVRAGFEYIVNQREFVTVGQFLRSRKAIIVKSCGLRFEIRPGCEDLGYVTRHHKEAVSSWFSPAPGQTVIDVGSHIGFFSAIAAQSGARVVAIEPNPQTFSLLKRNLALNRFESVEAINVAIGSRDGMVTLQVPSQYSGLSSVLESVTDRGASLAGGARIDVPGRRLDTLLGELGIEKVDWLLVDAEGSEVDVLRSAGALLKSVERIVIEVSYGGNAEQCEQILAEGSHLKILERAHQSDWNFYWLAKTPEAVLSDRVQAGTAARAPGGTS